MNFLLDTNVVSEWVRARPDEGVVAWLANVDEDRVFVSVVTLAELRYGVERMAEGRRRGRLEEWLREELPLRFEARLLDFDYKRIHYYQEMFHADEGYLAASYESISAHVDMRTRRTAPMPEPLTQRLAQVHEAHSQLVWPWQVGHVISTKRQEI